MVVKARGFLPYPQEAKAWYRDACGTQEAMDAPRGAESGACVGGLCAGMHLWLVPVGSAGRRTRKREE